MRPRSSLGRRGRTRSPFVAPIAIEDDLAGWLGPGRALEPVRPTRGVTKHDMVNNSALPAIAIDPETFAIRIDGDLVEPAPATGCHSRSSIRCLRVVTLSSDLTGLFARRSAPARGSIHPVRRVEPAVLTGCTAADVPDFLALRLRTIAAVDLGSPLGVCRARPGGLANWMWFTRTGRRTPKVTQRRAAEVSGAERAAVAAPALWPPRA